MSSRGGNIVGSNGAVDRVDISEQNTVFTNRRTSLPGRMYLYFLSLCV